MKEKLMSSSDGNVTRRGFLERAAVTGLTLAVLGSTTKSEVAGQTIRSTTVTKPGAPPNWGLLQKNVLGDVVLNNSPEYESCRRSMVWNAVKAERFPGAIVRVRSEADVRETIRFARANQLKVAIRGGGHQWHNSALRQGGLLIDLSGLNQLSVDASHHTAAVQPGVFSGTLMENLAPHGLAFPGAHVPGVRLSGFLLNGGLGNNYRTWGPSCARIEAIEVVNARGEFIRADRKQNQDLFWAARGAGPGFFGVVTRFHLKLAPLPRAILSSTMTYGVKDIDKVAAWLPQLYRTVPANVDWLLWSGAPGLYFDATAFADTVSDARKALEPFEAEPAGLSAVRKNLYRNVENFGGNANPPDPEGPRYLGEELWSNTSPQEILLSLREGILAAPSQRSAVMLWCASQEGWPKQPDMAYSRTGSTLVGVYGIWNDAAKDAAVRTWVRDTFASVDPMKVGYYVGDTDLAAAPYRAEQCFSPAAWAKLNRLKRKHDPNDMFFSYLQHA
ncbi:MAG: FAD-binding oxidoreductase [Acidobacteriota bacterium]